MKRVQTDAAIIDGLIKRSRSALPTPGDRHGRIQVLGEFGYIVSRIPRLTVLCRCDCGTTQHFYVQHLRKKAQSCGCQRIDETRARAAAMPYKRTKDPLYWVWVGMKNRCNNPNDAAFRYYGERGIEVCPEWQNFDVFRAWATGYGEGLSIERVDVNGNYEPTNCTWASPKEQANNTRKNVVLTAFGETKTVAQWSEDPRCPVSAGTLYARIETGWDDVSALTKRRAQEYGPTLKAFGKEKLLSEWARDPRCVVTYKVLWQRLRLNQFPSNEAAITSVPRRCGRGHWTGPRMAA